MDNHEKRLASAKCEPPKNNLAGASINSENTGSFTASQALSPEPVIVILDRIPTVAASSRVSANSSATSCAIRPLVGIRLIRNRTGCAISAKIERARV
ncbi:hypothetical protein NB311A_20171 [Nitrobacter sp. Nb-311A]|nr:hypothetical protein NB311A_20171 [Nitrobacter sp. Nb-311A]